MQFMQIHIIMIVTSCVIYERAKDLLPHYYKHYANLGVDKFCFGIFGDEKCHLWQEVKEFGEGLDVEISQIGNEYPFDMFLEGDFITRIRDSMKTTDWLVPTDLDEFHVVEGYNTFQQLQKDCEDEKADYVWSVTFDRVRADGAIPPSIDSSVPIWEQFPQMCRLTDTIAKAYCRKLCMVRQNILVSGGHHMVDKGYKKFSKEGITHHFKWFGDLHSRETTKVKNFETQNYKWIDENRRVIHFLETCNGNLLRQ